MYIQSLSFSNYRNLADASLALSPGFWAVLGDNGQGKTNLLEAAGAVCLGRSLRTERDREMMKLGADWMLLEGRCEREARGHVDLTIKMSESGRQLLVNRTPVGRVSRFCSESACITFTSDDVDIILGEPSVRRDFLNVALSQISQGFVSDWSRFRRALEQKNRLLKMLSETGGSPDVLDVWDEQIAQYGGRVCARRERYIRHLSSDASRIYNSLSAGSEPLELAYAPSVPAPETLEQWPDALREALRKRRADEVTRNMTLVGPQRDDISVLVSGKPARQYASRGQARTAALALKLAQSEQALSALGEKPILIMDDVFTELDESRRRLLAEVVSSAHQVFASSASPGDLPELQSAAGGIITVRSGVISIGEAH